MATLINRLRSKFNMDPAQGTKMPEVSKHVPVGDEQQGADDSIAIFDLLEQTTPVKHHRKYN